MESQSSFSFYAIPDYTLKAKPSCKNKQGFFFSLFGRKVSSVVPVDSQRSHYNSFLQGASSSKGGIKEGFIKHLSQHHTLEASSFSTKSTSIDHCENGWLGYFITLERDLSSNLGKIPGSDVLKKHEVNKLLISEDTTILPPDDLGKKLLSIGEELHSLFSEKGETQKLQQKLIQKANHAIGREAKYYYQALHSYVHREGQHTEQLLQAVREEGEVI